MDSSNITLVTGIWDLDRGNSSPEWNRPFQQYIDRFIDLLNELKNINLIIFIDKSIEDIVWKHRSKDNTRVYYHSKEEFSGNFFPFFDRVQKIRQDPAWMDQAGWLKDSTQGSLPYYNPMVMSKMFLLHNAKIFNPFNSTHMYWIDGGISSTLSLGYFNESIVISNLLKISDKFLFICFPYPGAPEIHGFSIEGMKSFSKSDSVDRVARGGFFGGNISTISEANNLYYNLLDASLSANYMGTEESIFTIMTYLDPVTYHYEMINSDGAVYTFFENLKQPKFRKYNAKTVDLYINTFNSPEQLQMVLDSFEKYEYKFLSETNLILINNSTDESLFDKYDEVCRKYDMQQIKKGNIGICGGRQLAADQFNASRADYMLFFEDDMLLDFENGCIFGFKKKVNNLYDSIVAIMQKESFDFLKLSFSEFYGNNGEQWSWHNVPNPKKEEYFGKLEHRPPTNFKHIKSFNHIPYATGEIYYSNWPHIISKDGNRKCFIDTKWQRPYEQTWMSHIYTLTINGTVNPGILLASPITHNRIHHYGAENRREN